MYARFSPVALPYFDAVALVRGWQFALPAASPSLSPSLLVLTEDGAHACYPFEALEAPDALTATPGSPHWAYRLLDPGDASGEPRVVVATPPTRAPGVAPLDGLNLPLRPIPDVCSGALVARAVVATATGDAFFRDEAARAHASFPSAPADLIFDFAVEAWPSEGVYHCGVFERSLHIGSHLLGAALVRDGVLLGIARGPAALRFGLWNVHLATLAAHALAHPAAWQPLLPASTRRSSSLSR